VTADVSPVELVVTSGARTGSRIPVDRDLVIGRGDDDDVRLEEDQRVSRPHARIRLESSRVAVIEDLGSGNGTFVNGVKIDGERMLGDGDVVVVGTTVFEVSVAEPERSPETVSDTVAPIRRIATLDQNGTLTTLEDGTELVIGREPDCDIVIASSEASRRHARIAQREGRWAVTDLGSLNGTYLNGERLGSEPHWLAPGDAIVIGGEKLTFDEATLPV
jgi:pSer/pThr/pTyr-binding forkhead associated (FHA) protein